MADPDRTPPAGLVEAGETSIGYRTRDEGGGPRRSYDGELPIAGAAEVSGDHSDRLRLASIADYSADSLHDFVKANAATGSTARTDGWRDHPDMPDVEHQPHVVGSTAAYLILHRIYRMLSNLKT